MPTWAGGRVRGLRCCRPDHLRIASSRQNGIAGLRGELNTAATSRHTGVYWDRRRSRWRTALEHRGRTRHLGSYCDEATAAQAYDHAVWLVDGYRVNAPARSTTRQLRAAIERDRRR